MECARCGGFLVIEGWGIVVDDIRERLLRTERCVNCGAIGDPVIYKNRPIERSASCCTTH